MTKVELYAIGTSTPLESNKSLKYSSQSFFAGISAVWAILAVVCVWIYSSSACCGWSGNSRNAQYYGPTQEP